MYVTLHFAERTFALHLLLQGLQGLIDIVVTDKNLYQRSLSIRVGARFSKGAQPTQPVKVKKPIAPQTAICGPFGRKSAEAIHQPARPVQTNPA
jgi:hypothetical protein